jgi:hypothetical protein
VTIGDSWPAGAELTDPNNSFPVLIARKLSVESVNLAEPATSADQALYRLLNTSSDIDWQRTLVLFCLTCISRSMNIDYFHPREIYPGSKTPASIAYYKYIHSNELDQFNRIRNILSAQQYCNMIGSKILFVNNWDKTSKHRAIDQSLFYNKTLTEILNIGRRSDDTDVDWYNLPKHEYILPNQCHPNISGHQKIADELSNWIKEKLNDQPVS